MFLDHEQRGIPPRWDPPRRKSAESKRAENAAITLILLISLLGLMAPVAGGTLVAMVLALMGH